MSFSVILCDQEVFENRKKGGHLSPLLIYSLLIA